MARRKKSPRLPGTTRQRSAAHGQRLGSDRGRGGPGPRQAAGAGWDNTAGLPSALDEVLLRTRRSTASRRPRCGQPAHLGRVRVGSHQSGGHDAEVGEIPPERGEVEVVGSPEHAEPRQLPVVRRVLALSRPRPHTRAAVPTAHDGRRCRAQLVCSMDTSMARIASKSRSGFQSGLISSRNSAPSPIVRVAIRVSSPIWM